MEKGGREGKEDGQMREKSSKEKENRECLNCMAQD